MDIKKRFKFYFLLIQLGLGLYFGNSIDLNNYGLSEYEAKLLIAAIKFNSKTNKQIHYIDLSNNNITILIVSDLLGLKSLKISKAKLERLYLNNLPNLTDLDISYNKLTSPLLAIATTIPLTNITLKANLLISFAFNLYPLLTNIDAASNCFKDINLGGLSKLLKATFMHNPLMTIFIGNLPEQTQLILPTKKLDLISNLQLIERTKQTASTTSVQQLPQINIERDQLFILTHMDLIAYFSKLITQHNKLHYKNNLFNSQKTYAYLRTGSDLIREAAVEIATDGLAADLHTYLTGFLQPLLAAYTKATNPQRHSLINQFAVTNLPNLVAKVRLTACKDILNNQPLARVIARLRLTTRPAPVRFATVEPTQNTLLRPTFTKQNSLLPSS